MRTTFLSLLPLITVSLIVVKLEGLLSLTWLQVFIPSLVAAGWVVSIAIVVVIAEAITGKKLS